MTDRAAGGGRRKEEVGWAVGGLQQGKERTRVGLESAQSKEGSLFLKKIFYFLFSKPFAILQNILQIQNCL
jgi:hypothetical protein